MSTKSVIKIQNFIQLFPGIAEIAIGLLVSLMRYSPGVIKKMLQETVLKLELIVKMDKSKVI